MIRRSFASISLGLALGALFAMGVTWMRDFTHWYISSEVLSAGAIAVGMLCFLLVGPARDGAIAGALAVLIGFVVQATVIMLPAWFGLVPNPVAYFNQATQQAAFACFIAGPYLVVGAVAGLIVRSWLQGRFG